MYLPYLYGRQYELLAVRMMLDDERDRDRLLPLIEPLVANSSHLLRCIALCAEAGQPLAVVVNPDKHELKAEQALADWWEEVEPIISETPLVIPTLVCRTDDARSDVAAFLQRFPERPVAVVYPGRRLNGADVQWLARQPQIRWHIVAVDKVPQARWQQLPREKTIALHDCFVKLDRNADYVGTEFFTDNHHRVPEDIAGVSDYLCVGSLFKDGGATPHAVAIHATYVEPEDRDVWVEHFVSTDITKDRGDVASKFVDAARKLTRAVRARPAEFGDNAALREFARLARMSAFPGLPTNKKLQMVHHMCLMMDVLEGRL
ncbi:sce7725 family protein [Luteibacter sp. PPL554]